MSEVTPKDIEARLRASIPANAESYEYASVSVAILRAAAEAIALMRDELQPHATQHQREEPESHASPPKGTARGLGALHRGKNQ